MNDQIDVELLIQNELEKVSHLSLKKKEEIETMLRTVVFMVSMGVHLQKPELVIDLVKKLQEYGIDIQVKQ